MGRQLSLWRVGFVADADEFEFVGGWFVTAEAAKEWRDDEILFTKRHAKLEIIRLEVELTSIGLREEEDG